MRDVSANNITGSSLSLTNSYGTTVDSTVYDGEIIVTQASATNSNLYAYQNGMFSIRWADTIAQDRYLRVVADIIITNSIKGATGISIAPFGNTSYATTAEIVNGKINLRFYYPTTANRNYISFRVGGNSLIIRNLKFYPA